MEGRLGLEGSLRAASIPLQKGECTGRRSAPEATIDYKDPEVGIEDLLLGRHVTSSLTVTLSPGSKTPMTWSA